MPDNPASIDDLGKGVQRVARKKQADSKDLLEQRNEELDRLKLENAEHRAKIDSTKVTTRLRIAYAAGVGLYLLLYTCGSGYIIAQCALGKMWLAPVVLGAIAGSTAVSAIALVGQVGKGLFPALPRSN